MKVQSETNARVKAKIDKPKSLFSLTVVIADGKRKE